jgi:uncharacterized protein YegL
MVKPKLSPSITKFALYDYQGKVKSYYLAEQKYLDYQEDNLIKPTIAHSIIIIDRSGSMYNEIETLKKYLLKLLTLDEYLNSQLVVTLISYSSCGDVQCHFQRIPITEIMDNNSIYQQEIKSINVNGDTCISQSLDIAKSLVTEFTQEAEKEEFTAITLDSDGFANDPNYLTECRKIEKIVQQLNRYNVIINTISYSDNADFKLLNKLANLASEKCVQAHNIKQVYDSLYITNRLLNSHVIYHIQEALEKEYNYQVFVSHTSKKIIGSQHTLNIKGLREKEKAIVYKYRQVNIQEYEDSKNIPVQQTHESVFAFAQANLTQGNLNLAKYALFSSLDDTLIKKHYQALTNAQIISFSHDLEQVIFCPQIIKQHHILSNIEVSNSLSILELIKILEEHKNKIIINFKYLSDNYHKKALKRIRGKRDQAQNLLEPWLKTVAIDQGEYVPMGSFKINRNTATVNLLIKRQIKLVNREKGKGISQVAGVLLNGLTQYNNYTIISDGEVNITNLKVKINQKKTFELLKAKKVIKQEGNNLPEFDFNSEYDLCLGNLPLISPEHNYQNLDRIVNELFQLQVLNSIISAHLTKRSDIYLTNQVEEFNKHYLSKNLYLNFPTTNEYQDLQEALNKGMVNSRISYKIDLGNTQILNLSKLYSANQFFNRLYAGYDEKNQQFLDKLTFDLTLEKQIQFSHKYLSPRLQISAVDEFMQEIVDDFLGLNKNGIVSEILRLLKADNLLALLVAKWQGKKIDQEEYLTALTQAQKLLNHKIETIYRQEISPLIFYIGTTGLIPEQLHYQTFTYQEMRNKYPQLKISKNEQQGTFFLIANTIITVYPKIVYYSTQKKIASPSHSHSY